MDANADGLQDETGNALFGAKVEVLDCNKGKALTRSTTITTDKPVYEFNDLPVGMYEVRVTAPSQGGAGLGPWRDGGALRAGLPRPRSSPSRPGAVRGSLAPLRPPTAAQVVPIFHFASLPR